MDAGNVATVIPKRHEAYRARIFADRLVDREVTAVVRRIYRLSIKDYGVTQIAKILMEERVERPSYYLAKKRGDWFSDKNADMSRPYDWASITVS